MDKIEIRKIEGGFDQVQERYYFFPPIIIVVSQSTDRQSFLNKADLGRLGSHLQLHKLVDCISFR